MPDVETITPPNTPGTLSTNWVSAVPPRMTSATFTHSLPPRSSTAPLATAAAMAVMIATTRAVVAFAQSRTSVLRFTSLLS